MIHMVAHADLEDIKHLRREFCLEAMRGEGAQGDTQESGDRACDKEKTVHESLRESRISDYKSHITKICFCGLLFEI